MEEADVVVVGGSAAGVTAAVTARRHYPDRSVLLVRKEKQVLIPCGIPYIFGTVGSPEKNLIPDTTLSSAGVEILVDEVTAIERDSHRLLTTGETEIGYERLVLATGSSPVMPPIPGADKANVFAVTKDIPYLRRMTETLDTAKGLVIVGGGFIGCELAEECRKRRPDLAVTIVEVMRHCLQLVYDEGFCLRAEAALKEEGINILAHEKVEAFLGSERVERVRLSGGRELRADMVIMCTGAGANTELARKAGLRIGPTKAIEVNRYQQSVDDPHIFACGDCAEKVSFFDDSPSPLKLASIAATEARIAGANLFEFRRTNTGVIGVYSTVIGGSVFAAAGLTEAQATQRGYKTFVGESEALNRHPSGMPGAAGMKVRLVFSGYSRRLLGGQVSGAAGGGELVNTISACVQQGMSADDIAVFQMGTHPALTASPIAYQLVNAAEMALAEARKTSMVAA